ncbi:MULTISPECIES: FecR family protein [Lysobacter]|uniref:FecR domain-containing protein n=1 Tax=Lysobacter gummosus TaxID=262324 RepID=A0ABY3XFF0_9GAMM|nr:MULTISPECIES: FecR domain-containing protein [Lysobacter]UJB18354.1 FecR domain-containing protein [Lysobacter capsici]UJQ27922.1 FecR domain-containing protein [Lysobacter gummosus]UNP30364.1 FecR domain-containing protein [Lysobacter gummosus]
MTTTLPTSTTTPTADPADGRAEAWVARLDSPECTAQDRAEFDRWLDAAPEHVTAYVAAERAHQAAAQLASDEMLQAAARIAWRATGRESARSRWWMPAAMAASLLVATAVGVNWLRTPAPASDDRYLTAVGEQRSLRLADGTQVMLDTDSVIVARFSDERREVEVDRGRVQFQVAADAARPFSVKAGNGLIRDIGTTFQVIKTDSTVNVGLLEGEVIVSNGVAQADSTLKPGQQLSYDHSGRMSPPEPLDLNAAQAWPTGDLVFKNRRLDALLIEMNRYSATKLRLADPALGKITVSGVFHIGDQAALLEALEQGWSLQSEQRADDEIVLHRKSG